MQSFQRNISQIYGAQGDAWLGNLPLLVREIAKKYSLSQLLPFENLTYHYVLSGYQGHDPVVLKFRNRSKRTISGSFRLKGPQRAWGC